MAMTERIRNEHPWWVDVAKQFLDEYGQEMTVKVLDTLLPPVVRNWLAADPAWNKILGAALSAASIGASRIISDTPLGVIAEEAVREVVATLKDYLGAEVSPQALKVLGEKLPEEVKTKIKVAEAAVKLGMGDLKMEEAKKIAKFVNYVKVSFSIEAAHTALIMLDGMGIKDLSRFSRIGLDNQLSEFAARTYKPSPPPAMAQRRRKAKKFFVEQRRSLATAIENIGINVAIAEADREVAVGRWHLAKGRLSGIFHPQPPEPVVDLPQEDIINHVDDAQIVGEEPVQGENNGE